MPKKIWEILQVLLFLFIGVCFVLLRLGGILLKKKERELLVKEGVHFTYYNKPAFPYLFSSLEHRNHRRISVIDGRIGYIVFAACPNVAIS
jgi:cardiolipin synthase A/B